MSPSVLDRSRTPPRSWLQSWPYATVALVFLGSRLVYRWEFDVHFDRAPVDSFIQYLDPWFIRNDFLRSLLHLHHQPPLQNLLVGGALRVFGWVRGFAVLEALYVALGLATALACLEVMIQLGANKVAAVVATSLYVVMPATVLYENWLFYQTPVTCLLIVAVALLIRYYRSGSVRAGIAYFGALAAVALFRSTFGGVFLAAVLGLVLAYPPRSPRDGGVPARIPVLKAAAIPALLLVLNGLRVLLLVGPGSNDALFWGNIVEKIHVAMPAHLRARVRETGAVSPAVDHFCLADLSTIPELRVPVAPTGIPLLDLAHTPDGHRNPHALEYIAIGRKYYKPDAIYLLTHYSYYYWRAVAEALSYGYLISSLDVDAMQTSENRAHVRTVDEATQRILGRDERGRLWAIVLALPLGFIYAIYRVLGPARKLESQRCSVVAIATLLLTVSYVTVVSVLISFGDFSRYRSDVDPLFLVLFTLLASDLGRTGVASFRSGSHRLFMKG